jgi:hypothetical protein
VGSVPAGWPRPPQGSIDRVGQLPRAQCGYRARYNTRAGDRSRAAADRARNAGRR